ncbi:MAG: homogentisate 1,2-dioxygenase [Acidobacteriota bacterium]|nr:homogentisate 1,2-dioxygenase [Acidobacteriota bacterium]
MPIYHSLGTLPKKKHITFEKEDGSLYREELFSTLGFAGIYSTLYHIHMPTEVHGVKPLAHVPFEPWEDAPKAPFHFFTFKAQAGGDIVTARKTFLYNSDITLSTASFTELDDAFYRNGRADEVLFVHKGNGELHSEYGVLPFRKGDYLVVPRGVMYRFENLDADNRFFITESYGPVETPRRYRNPFGQLLEDAPFSERDMHLPQWRDPIDSKEPARLIVKSNNRYHEYTLDHHPFDVVGWDGYLYPWSFNIEDFQPIVGQIHLPPPIHQVFQTPGAVICNFVPRLFDFHPKAVPAPYAHQNIDSDEVLYYVEGDFMSRKGIEEGSITLHPGDVPHGPQPGKTEASVGVKDCYEYAVMVDTFKPLELTTLVRETMDEDYIRSWLS